MLIQEHEVRDAIDIAIAMSEVLKVVRAGIEFWREASVREPRDEILAQQTEPTLEEETQPPPAQ